MTLQKGEKMTKLKTIAVHTMFATIVSQPIIALSQTQEQHREAQREQDAHDKRHHNTAKVVGGSAAGGAVVGGLMGGGKGATANNSSFLNFFRNSSRMDCSIVSSETLLTHHARNDKTVALLSSSP